MLSIIALIISIIALINSIVVFIIIKIEVTPWGESETIDNSKEMLYKIRDKRIELHWKIYDLKMKIRK